jgi:hypothetical protein
MLYPFIIPPFRAKWSAIQILVLIAIIILGEEYKL